MCYPIIVMTEDELQKLYNEVGLMMFKKVLDPTSLTSAQLVFTLAFEDSAFGTDMLTAYSSLVDNDPSISIRDLHAFCLGHALAKSYKLSVPSNRNDTFH